MHQDSPEDRTRTQQLIEAFRSRFPGDLLAGGIAENDERLRELVKHCRLHYQVDALIVRAPGRVNLIGEHTDYNDGFVLPIAIEYDVRFVVRPRSDRLVRLYSVDFDSSSEFDLDRIERDPENQWANYVRGMAAELQGAGCLLRGMEGVIGGNVPIASGLSSSAATEVAAGMALTLVGQQEVEPPCLAQLAQAAENNYMGVRVGIMDQFVSRMGHPGHALFLDCRSLECDLIPIPAGEYRFVVTNSKMSRELAGSAYNERRAQCEAAVAALQPRLPGIKALRDVTPEALEQHKALLEPLVYHRARHVVTENARVLEAVEALRGGDLPRFGALMNASHDSLRDDYEVSSTALDTLVNAARGAEGCLGSRLTGAGFGGCTVSLVRADRVDGFRGRVAEVYQRDCGKEPEFYLTQAAAGAGAVSGH